MLLTFIHSKKHQTQFTLNVDCHLARAIHIHSCAKYQQQNSNNNYVADINSNRKKKTKNKKAAKSNSDFIFLFIFRQQIEKEYELKGGGRYVGDTIRTEFNYDRDINWINVFNFIFRSLKSLKNLIFMNFFRKQKS